MKLFYVPALLISMVVGTWAIECYVCFGGACNDPFFPTSSSSTCGGFGSDCLKIVEGSTVSRFCAESACASGCVGDICTYCCNSNLCNGGTAVTTSFVAMGVAMLAAFILARQ
ncbi:uncharacterized protein LOC100890927 [Strongylocentrotus purpuratus]|uniref:Uncharacterized protein n=1 Tax=Strongylocentrotus purpuratus TaxID=7668 RepID=A0A7M7P252_STRPU|nr:uncharacterized protein LOC100890927 [Strongylocentrotus purpuratus]|eukprot:XP_003730069.1 PREDICTED: uncharacterized protein LOC100890927 [Strongylocentrotus purpuratus]